jgi:hypothetical protein
MLKSRPIVGCWGRSSERQRASTIPHRRRNPATAGAVVRRRRAFAAGMVCPVRRRWPRWWCLRPWCRVLVVSTSAPFSWSISVTEKTYASWSISVTEKTYAGRWPTPCGSGVRQPWFAIHPIVLSRGLKRGHASPLRRILQWACCFSLAIPATCGVNAKPASSRHFRRIRQDAG